MHTTSYIVTCRATDDPARRANLETVLAWLKLQTLAEAILVEQDVAPTLGDLPSFPGLRSLFAYNPGPFNESWGFNIGVRASKGSVLAFGDGDVLCRGLSAAVAAVRSGAPVVRAFSQALDLDEPDSDILRADLSCLGDPSFGVAALSRVKTCRCAASWCCSSVGSWRGSAVGTNDFSVGAVRTMRWTSKSSGAERAA